MTNTSAPASFVSPLTLETALEEQPCAYVLRCKFNEQIYSEVFSSIATSSVSLYGIRFRPDNRGSIVEVFAVLSLAQPVNAENSRARVEGNELVLILPKADQPLDSEAGKAGTMRA